MEGRQSAKQSGNADLAKSLNDAIRKAMQQDKLAHLKAELEEPKDETFHWTGLKKLRARPNLRFTKLKDKDGNRSTSKEYPP